MDERIYKELRRIAASYMARQQSGHTLEPTALVHEAYLRLADSADGEWADAGHFRATAATAMRQILVDHARRRGAKRRGGDGFRITLGPGVAVTDAPDIDLLAVDEALEELAAMTERRARVVELRFFGGMTSAEIGATLGIAAKTADADWYFARAWLRKRFAETPS